ncbi:MAG: hypothetical protein C5B60_03415 [Chloroflexi bacterium]|nr:MAG: hypothetical protein C5B60_03415 [Chloroflexota bacterium]
MPASAIPPGAPQDWTRGQQSNQPYPPNSYGQVEQPAGPYPGGAPPGYGPNPMGAGLPPRIPVNSLVNEGALPEWLRNAAHSGALPPPAEPRGIVQGNPDARGSGYRQPPTAYPPVPPSPAGSGNLTAHHLFDESALPEWLRSGAAGQSPDLPTASPQALYGQGGYGMAGAGPQAGLIPDTGYPVAPAGAAFPSIEHAGSFQAPLSPESGLSAPSLIDSNALPQWLSGRPGDSSATNYGRDQARGIPGNSLVDENALPQWLRNEHPAPPNQAASSTWNGSPAGNQPMASWLNQGYGDASTPRMESPYAQPSAWTGYPTPMAAGKPANPGESYLPGTLAAGEFVDEAALPEWLRSQGGIPGMAPPPGTLPAGQPTKGAGSPGYVAPNLQEASLLANGGAAGTFSASDLIDPSALPDWVRGSEAGPAASFSSTAGWTNRQPVPPAPADSRSDQPAEMSAWPTVKQPAANGSFSPFSASSAEQGRERIPTSELPPWLSNDTSGAAGPGNAKRPTARQQPNPTGRRGRAGGMEPESPRNRGRRDRSYRSRMDYEASQNDVSFNEYDNYDAFDEYAGYDGRYQADRRHGQPERRGWRRFFGRK